MTARRTPKIALALSLLAVFTLASSCGGGSEGESVDIVAADQFAKDDQPTADAVDIRLALAPDPVWQVMYESDVVPTWESKDNISIDATNPFNPSSALAAGQADAAVINALDVPSSLQNSERDLIILGKVSADRSFVAVSRTTQAKTLDDLIEKKIAVEGALGSTLMWGLIAYYLHDLEFTVGSPDFELVVVDASSAADLVMRGDVDACVCVPDFSASMLAEGLLRPLYDGQSAAELYAARVLGDPAALPFAEALVVDREWHRQNPDAAMALVGMWDHGLRTWATDRANHVRRYPHLLSIQSEEEIAWMIDFLELHDWIEDSALIAAEDSERYLDMLARMREIGLVPEDVIDPEIVVSGAST